MLLQIQLPDREHALAFNRQRWGEILDDPQWHAYVGRIETNGFGQIVMSPPPELLHGSRQFRIAMFLEQRLVGRAVTECPILTADGVKAADAAWFSNQRYAQVREQRAAEIAPEICVEVLSASNSNTASEMQAKRQLYFAAGAIECWTCDLNGRMAYYDVNDPETAQKQSKLCPDFPQIISD